MATTTLEHESSTLLADRPRMTAASPASVNTRQSEMSKGAKWASWIMLGIGAVFMVFDSVIKLVVAAPVVETFAHLGLPIGLATAIGLLELACLVLYLVPRTAVLGAVLLTGYLGGACAMQVRIGEPLFGFILFPVYIGLLLWGSLYLREPRLRALLPMRSGK